MENEKFDKTKTEKVKIGEIGDKSHGEQALTAIIEDMARDEAKRRKRETFKEYQERTKNDPPKKIKDLIKDSDIKTVGSHVEFGPPVGIFIDPRTGEIDSERFVREVCAGIVQIERKLRKNEPKNINKEIDRENMYKKI